MLDTSGIMVQETLDGLVLQYADYDVEVLHAREYEATYTLDKENSKKFIQALKDENYTGSVQEMVEKAFTKVFSVNEFNKFCKKYDIHYEFSSWTSYD